ncbi:DUF7196 family protein [Nocardia farcinica]|uniref:DUF7196 family protein n=1 Tax=Nocardia farcinica TaxID=37329 RepID=UPI003D7BECFE
MASCCGGAPSRASNKSVTYRVTTYQGESFGPFLTITEARVKLTEQGGGVINEVRGEA